jgi:flagellar biosynthesis/type III secretory pathway protein FliH
MDKKIFKLDSEVTQDVRAFEMTNLKPGSSDTFRTPTLSGKRPSRPSTPIADLARKDRRFQVDPVLRDLVSADDETNLEVEMRVREKLDALREVAERDGKESGYEEGHARGKAEAKASFEAASTEKLARLDTLIAGIEGVKAEIFKANERFLVELVYRISGSVLQKEILIDREYMARVVRSVVEKVGVKEQLKLIVSATQLESLYAILPELEKKHTGLKNVTIEASSQLGDADVVIETDWNRVDATLASQLGSLHEVVLAALDDSQIAAASESA